MITIKKNHITGAAYTMTNVSTDRALDCNLADDDSDVTDLKGSVAEVADVLGTLVADLTAVGVLS